MVYRFDGIANVTADQTIVRMPFGSPDDGICTAYRRYVCECVAADVTIG